MSDNYEYDDEYDDFEQEQEANGPRALREQVKRLKAQLATERKEKETLRSTVVERSVTDVLAGQNFKNPAAVKKAILADGVDATDATAIQNWLKDNGDDYAKAAPANEGSEETPAGSVDAEVVAAHQKLDVQGTPTDASGLTEKWAKVQAKITDDMTSEQVAKLYREHGI